jgi:hypothetical protein
MKRTKVIKETPLEQVMSPLSLITCSGDRKGGRGGQKIGRGKGALEEDHVTYGCHCLLVTRCSKILLCSSSFHILYPTITGELIFQDLRITSDFSGFFFFF